MHGRYSARAGDRIPYLRRPAHGRNDPPPQGDDGPDRGAGAPLRRLSGRLGRRQPLSLLRERQPVGGPRAGRAAGQGGGQVGSSQLSALGRETAQPDRGGHFPEDAPGGPAWQEGRLRTDRGGGVRALRSLRGVPPAAPPRSPVRRESLSADSARRERVARKPDDGPDPPARGGAPTTDRQGHGAVAAVDE